MYFWVNESTTRGINDLENGDPFPKQQKSGKKIHFVLKFG